MVQPLLMININKITNIDISIRIAYYNLHNNPIMYNGIKN